jgi:hypothetical protein
MLGNAMTLSFIFAGAGLTATALVAMREHAKVLASRRTLLYRCSALLTQPEITHGNDGFPGLDGYHRGRFIRAELVPDTMTIRRLPQLWLKLTRIEVRSGFPEFSVLIRPSGNEFYSLTSTHSVTLRPPGGLAPEMIAKGDCAASQEMLDAASSTLRRLFADPRMKEVAVTGKGLRLIWQADEGERGAHLILRQCRFEDAAVSAEVFAARLADLDELSGAIDQAREAQAA